MTAKSSHSSRHGKTTTRTLAVSLHIVEEHHLPASSHLTGCSNAISKDIRANLDEPGSHHVRNMLEPKVLMPLTMAFQGRVCQYHLIAAQRGPSCGILGLRGGFPPRDIFQNWRLLAYDHPPEAARGFASRLIPRGPPLMTVEGVLKVQKSCCASMSC